MATHQATRKPGSAPRPDDATAAASGSSGSAAGVPLFLQSSLTEAGSLPVQTKLQVGRPGDVFEEEADRVAEQASSGSASRIPPSILEEERQDTLTPDVVQRKEGGSGGGTGSGSDGGGSAVPAASLSSSMGSPLVADVRERAEAVLGQDLGGVRVHDDPSAHVAAASIHAKAFTHRNHIWLGAGQRADDVSLLAHEAAHVAQQTARDDRREQPPALQRQEASSEVDPEQASFNQPRPFPVSEDASGEASEEQQPVDAVAAERDALESTEEESQSEIDASQEEIEEGAAAAEAEAEAGEEGEEGATEGEGEEGAEGAQEEGEAGAGEGRGAASETAMGGGGGGEGAEEAVEGGGGGGALIDEELAEHERWAGSFGSMGTAGSDQRAQFLLDQAGQGAVSGAESGAVMGFAMSAIGAAVGQVAGRRLATLAVSRGASATPVPGLGAAIGGVMAVVGLATRPWGQTFDTIGKIGEGEGYEGLANDLEGIAEVLDVACSVMDVLAGVLGAIAVGMWVGAVLSAGVLSPLATTLSAIALGINAATTAIGIIISVVVRPTVVALRALHTFQSQGDPTQIEAEGQMLQGAAGQITGAVAGAAAGRAGGRVGGRMGGGADQVVTGMQARQRGGAPSTSSAASGPGPRIHVEVPEAPTTRVDAAAPASTRTAAPDTPSTTARPASTEGPAAATPTKPQPLPQEPHPITPDVVIRGDFRDSSLKVLTKPNQGKAKVGTVGPHHWQGERGPAVQSEHVLPGAQARDATFDPKYGAPDWQRNIKYTDQEGQPRRRDAPDYSRMTSIGEHTAVSKRKDILDNAATRAQQSGQPLGMTDQVLGSLQRHDQAVKDAIAAGEITPQQATDPTHRALAGFAAKWESGEAGGSAKARADAAAAGTRLPNPRSASRRRQLEADRKRARLAEEQGPSRDWSDEDWDATFTEKPSASSPSASSTATVPRSAHASHTETVRTTDRAAAMAQYHEQIRTDPGRESGVWRGADGTFYVMQGDSGSVRPPSAGGPLELVYHSHPTEATAAAQGMVSQPSQAGGDVGVLQYQHGQGPAGKRQSSELHFPVYDQNGNHTGYGATRFAYDPTHPLPIQVQTTRPDGTTGTQRYASFEEFESRTGIRAGGSSPAESMAARAQADARLGQDVAAARQRIDETAGALTGPPRVLGVREGRQAGRSEIAEESGGDGSALAGPAYTAAVPGLEPGESLEIPINPAYPEPPGTTAELDVLMAQVEASRQAQGRLSSTESQMETQAGEQQAHEAELGEAQTVAGDLATGRSDHQGTVDETQSTNTEQQSTAEGAIDNLGRSAQEATALTTLVGSLRMFQGLAHLFSYLPGDLGQKAEGAKSDAEGLITTLNRVSETDAVQGSVETGRTTMEADATRIESVGTAGEATDQELTSGQEGITGLTDANAQALAETEAVQEQAGQEGQAAAGAENDAQSAHDELLAQLQSWADAHRQARVDAIAEATAQYSELGYTVTESA